MATLASMTVRLGIDTDRLQAGADQAKKILTGIGKAVAGLGVGVPVAAAAAAAVGGMAAAAASAGAAYKAFKMAAAPQMEAVRSVSELAAAAQEAAAEGGEKAAAAQKAYTDALGKLPPATQATAKAFIGLQKDQQAWSDSLASSTMPVYTKGIGLLRQALPLLTPLVKAAAGAFSGWLDSIEKAASGGGLKRFADDLAQVAGKNLRSFLDSITNVGVGFAGMLSAFLPVSTKMSGGIEDMTARFAEWGQSLKGSAGFDRFLAMAGEGGQMIGQLALAAGKLLVALAPLIGITTAIALKFAEIINATPKPVLTALAVTIGTVLIAMKLWAAAQALVALRNRIWTTTQWSLNASMLANPIFLIIVAIIALVAIIVLIATKTTWFQTAWTFVWNAVKTAFAAAVAGIMTALDWLKALPGKISVWFGQAKDWAIRKLLELVAWVRGVPGRIRAALASLAGNLASSASTAWQRFKTASVAQVVSVLAYIRGIPGKVKSALGNLGSLLLGAGKAIIQGLIRGVTSMLGSLKNKFGEITSMIPDLKGPMTLDLKLLTPSGQAVMTGFMGGIDKSLPDLRKQLAGVTSEIPGNLDVGVRTAGAASGGALGREVVFRLADGSDEFKRWFRSLVKADSGGDIVKWVGGT